MDDTRFRVAPALVAGAILAYGLLVAFEPILYFLVATAVVVGAVVARHVLASE